GAALHADPALRLAHRRRQPAGDEARPAGIYPQAALPPADFVGERIWDRGAMKRVEIFTDGACSGNPGPGGWGAILRFNGKTKELSGGEAATTNNRMELMAAISALNALTEPCEIDLYTDSKYVMDGISGWIHGWKQIGRAS